MDLSSLTDAELASLAEKTKNNIAKHKVADLALKETLNSLYGASGSEYFRFFDVRNATAITVSGQLIIQWFEKRINKFLQKTLNLPEKDFVITCDTDSAYIILEDFVERYYRGDKSDTKKVIRFMNKVCNEIIQPQIDRIYEQLAEYVNAYENKMSMKREALAERGLWNGKKKRYILSVWDQEGVEYNEPDIKVVGMDLVRSSTPPVCRAAMKEVVRTLMLDTQEATLEVIERFETEFKKMSPNEIAASSSANNIDKYTENAEKGTWILGCPGHVKGAIIYNAWIDKLGLKNKYAKIQDRDKIKTLKLYEPNKFGADVISFPDILPPEFGVNECINYRGMFEKTFLKPVQSILDAIGWKAEPELGITFLFG